MDRPIINVVDDKIILNLTVADQASGTAVAAASRAEQAANSVEGVLGEVQGVQSTVENIQSSVLVTQTEINQSLTDAGNIVTEATQEADRATTEADRALSYAESLDVDTLVNKESIFNATEKETLDTTDKIIAVGEKVENVLSSLNSGISNSSFLSRTGASVSFIPNTGFETPPDLSHVSHIVRTMANSGNPVYNWYIQFDGNWEPWTFGVWLRKSEYPNGITIHSSWIQPSPLLTEFSNKAVPYSSIVEGFSGITTTASGTQSFNATFIIKSVIGDWFYLQIKQGNFDSSFPGLTRINILPYPTGGTVIGTPVHLFNPGLVLNDVELNPLEDYTEKFYRTTLTIPDPVNNNIVDLILPDEINTFVGDRLQIFKNSILNAYNTEIYNIQVVSGKVTGTDYAGDDYNRYWEFIPTIVESFTVTFNAYDNNRTLISTKDVQINVANAPTSPVSNFNVMFVGDSLTYYNRIPDEFIRVLTSTNAQTTTADNTSTNTVVKLAGKNLTNITAVGTQRINHLGWTGVQYHEGYSGREWSGFISSVSPFWFSGAINFSTYLSTHSISGIDIMFIGMGWNDIVKTQTDWQDNTVIIENAKTFLRSVKAQLPSTKVYLWSENMPGTIGGEGKHPYGSDPVIDVQDLKLKMGNLIKAYQTLANDVEFSSFVSLIGSHARFDSENMMQQALSPLNSRVTNTEMRGTDDVHPSDGGFFQITDAIIADFIYNHL